MRRPVKSLNIKSLLICLTLLVSVSLVEVICAYAFGSGFSLSAVPAASTVAANSVEGSTEDVVAQYKALNISLDPYAESGSASGTENANPDDVEKDEAKISYVLNASLVLKNGKTPAKLQIENPLSNSYLIKVRIVTDDGLVIYESGFIGPGMQIKEAPLDTELEKGEYTAKAYITAYQVDEEQTVFGDISEQPVVTIQVKN